MTQYIYCANTKGKAKKNRRLGRFHGYSRGRGGLGQKIPQGDAVALHQRMQLHIHPGAGLGRVRALSPNPPLDCRYVASQYERAAPERRPKAMNDLKHPENGGAFLGERKQLVDTGLSDGQPGP